MWALYAYLAAGALYACLCAAFGSGRSPTGLRLGDFGRRSFARGLLCAAGRLGALYAAGSLVCTAVLWPAAVCSDLHHWRRRRRRRRNSMGAR